MFCPERYLGARLVSSATGEGLEGLRDAIGEALGSAMEPAEATIPYQRLELLTRWRRYGVVETEQFTSDGVHVRGRLPQALLAAVASMSPQPEAATSAEL
jgi:GTP-binding protein HflX